MFGGFLSLNTEAVKGQLQVEDGVDVVMENRGNRWGRSWVCETGPEVNTGQSWINNSSAEGENTIKRIYTRR